MKIAISQIANHRRNAKKSIPPPTPSAPARRGKSPNEGAKRRKPSLIGGFSLNSRQKPQEMTDDRLYEYMDAMLRQTPMDFFRYKFGEINWNARLVGIVGPRGIGKSTMVLQHIKQGDAAHSLYVSADTLYFAKNSIVDFADEFVKEGGTRLYIDEIHKYSGWSRELKQVYDTHPDLRIVFTGSSVLDIRRGEADLSRRALVYPMQGLSFREYLHLFHGIKCRAYTLDEILGQKVSVPELPHPLPLFRDYLRGGYYPFAIQGDFAQRMEQVVSQTVESDIPQYADMKSSTARKLKRMLAIISTLAPFKPNIESLAAEIGVSKNNVPEYLSLLERAGMIGLLRDDTSGLRGLGKVEKVYIDNPSLMCALTETPNTGNLRETFFYNQMRVRQSICASKASDFCAGGYTFEVGGRKKGKKQIEGVENGRIVKDDIETGHGIVVPLWHFGMNY